MQEIEIAPRGTTNQMSKSGTCRYFKCFALRPYCDKSAENRLKFNTFDIVQRYILVFIQNVFKQYLLFVFF